MPQSEGDKVVKAIEENTRAIKSLEKTLKPKPVNFTQTITGPEEGGLKTEEIPEEVTLGQVVVHRPEAWSQGHIFRAACADLVLVDESVLTVSLNENMINCPSCKNPQ